MTSASNLDGAELEPEQSKSWQAQYDHWLAHLAPPPLDATGLTARPVIGLFVDPGSNAGGDGLLEDLDELRRTLDSLTSQTYESWQAWILPSQHGIFWPLTQDKRVGNANVRLGSITAALRQQLSEATCDYVACLPTGDELKPDALLAIAASINQDGAADVIYTDRNQRAADGSLTLPFFKPDWSPALLTSMDYVSGLAVYRRELLLQALAGDDLERDAIGYELALRATEIAGSIRHIEGPYYTKGSSCADRAAECTALEKALQRRGQGGRVLEGRVPGVYETRPALKDHPKVTIIIPTRDRLELLKASVESVRAKTTYDNYEIMLIDNESVEPATLEYMARFDGPVFRYPHPFNYARMMNLAAWESDAPYVVFLNNDTEIISPYWLEGMLEQCEAPDVAIVGTRILHMDKSVHHEGITLWRHNVTVAHIWFPGYHGLSYAVREVAAVTGACLMAKSSAFREIDGFDERMTVGYNDVDLCMRIREKGYRVIYNGNVELYHHAGASRGRTTPLADELFFLDRWPPETTRDPYFPDNLRASWPVAILAP